MSSFVQPVSCIAHFAFLSSSPDLMFIISLYEELMIFFFFFFACLAVNLALRFILSCYTIIIRQRVMMYFLYRLVCFLIYINSFFMDILTNELKGYFVIED